MTTKTQQLTPEQLEFMNSIEKKLELASKQLLELHKRVQYLERENSRRKSDLREVASMAIRK